MRWLSVLLALAAPAAGQGADRMIADMAGRWFILPTDGRAGCAITLTAERSDDAWRAVPASGCAPPLAGLSTVRAWSPDDGVALFDGSGRRTMTFVEDETALLSSPDLHAPLFYLIRAIPGFTKLPQRAAMAGTWTLSRRGTAVCTLALSLERPPGTAAGFAMLRPGKACPDESIGRLSRWSLEDLKLMAWGPDDRLIAFRPVGRDRYAALSGDWTLAR